MGLKTSLLQGRALVTTQPVVAATLSTSIAGLGTEIMLWFLNDDTLVLGDDALVVLRITGAGHFHFYCTDQESIQFDELLYNLANRLRKLVVLGG